MIQIHKHPTRHNILSIETSPAENTHMHQLESALYDRELKSYLLPDIERPALDAWIRHNDIRYIDNTREPNRAGSRRQAQECRHCGQPGSWSNPPTSCPACRNVWDPITPTDALTLNGWTASK